MATAKTRKKKPAEKKLQKRSLIAVKSELSNDVNVNFSFTSGIGQATASLFRSGILINMQSISSSGMIHFADVQSSDGISINGVCTGNCRIAINTNTTPATPESFPAGIIMTGYLIN